jgi:cell division FtsZ-interacting protein ZapD
MAKVKVIYPGDVLKWPHKQRQAFLGWLGLMGLDPKRVGSIQLNEDGTVDAVLFTLDAKGQRLRDPEDRSRALTVIQNFTPKVPCPEQPW